MNELISSTLPPPLISKISKKRVLNKGPTTGYRDGLEKTVEVMDFIDGWIPEGWFDTPAHCANFSGGHATTEYVLLKNKIRR